MPDQNWSSSVEGCDLRDTTSTRQMSSARTGLSSESRPLVERSADVRADDQATASSSLVHPPLLVRPSPRVPLDGRPSGSVATKAQRLGRSASHHRRAQDRPRAQRHGRLLRGRAEPRHDGDERLGRGRAGVVAEPAGPPRRSGRTADGPRLVTGRAATGDERERLWARWREIDKNLDAYAARRSQETAVVILEPR